MCTLLCEAIQDQRDFLCYKSHTMHTYLPKFIIGSLPKRMSKSEILSNNVAYQLHNVYSQGQ